MGWLDPNALVALLTLTAMEVVLGIDNIIFITILSGKLPAGQQQKARTTGLAVALVSRILLLFSLSWIMRLTQPLFAPFGHPLSGRDLILLVGGMFLIWKATREIHHKVEGVEEGHKETKAVTFGGVIAQIFLIDMVFSLDSVITAVGMVDDIRIMIVAVIVSVLVMILAAGSVSAFVERHPTVKMLALSFLLLIGCTLMAEAFEFHLPKGYVYFAMAFSVFVEMLNIRASKARKHKVA